MTTEYTTADEIREQEALPAEPIRVETYGETIPLVVGVQVLKPPLNPNGLNEECVLTVMKDNTQYEVSITRRFLVSQYLLTDEASSVKDLVRTMTVERFEDGIRDGRIPPALKDPYVPADLITAMIKVV